MSAIENAAKRAAQAASQIDLPGVVPASPALAEARLRELHAMCPEVGSVECGGFMVKRSPDGLTHYLLVLATERPAEGGPA